MVVKVHAYCRTSKTEQETLPIQHDAIEKMYLGKAEIVWYDEQLSGWDGKYRHEYELLKRRIHQGGINEVCFYSVSRMGRNVQEASAFMTLCQRMGVRVKVCLENLDFSGPMGYAMFVLFSALAEMDSSMKSQRTRATIAKQKENGTFKPHGNVLGIVSERVKRQAPHVYAMSDAGQSNKSIAIALALTERTVANLLKRRGENLMTRADYARLHPGWHETPANGRKPATKLPPEESTHGRRK